MIRDQLLQFIKTTDLFSHFSEQEIVTLLPYFQIALFQPGEYIVREGGKGENLFSLVSGKAEIMKDDPRTQQTYTLGELKIGEWSGELAALEKRERSASIRVIEPSEVLIFLLDKLEQEDAIFAKLQTLLFRKVSQRLRTTDEQLVVELTEKFNLLKDSNNIGETLVHIFVVIAIWFNMFLLLRSIHFKHPAIDPLLTFSMLASFAYSVYICIKHSNYPLETYGLTLKRGWYNFFEAIYYSIPILVFFTLFKLFLITQVDAYKHLTLFGYKPANQTPTEGILFGLVYLMSVPVQEYVIRGGMQSLLRNYFHGKNNVFRAILCSNLVFSMLHTVKSVALAGGTFLLGFFWGYLLEHQRSLVGPITSHMLVGGWLYLVLDMQSLLSISI